MGKNSKGKAVIFKEVAKEWLESRKDLIKNSSYMVYLNILEEKVFPKIAKKKMKNVCKRETLEEFEKELVANNCSDTMIANIMFIVKSVVMYHQGMIKEVGVLKGSREIVVLEKNDVNAIFQNFENSEVSSDFNLLGTAIILYTGLSVSELCALKWKDISLDAEEIVISSRLRREVTDSGNQTQIFTEELENVRIVPLHNYLANLIMMYKQNNLTNSNYYILSNSEKCYEPRNFQRYTSILSKRLFIKCSPKILRDTFVVNSLKSDVNPLVLIAILGTSTEHFYKRYEEFLTDPKDTLEQINKLAY